MAVQDLIDWYKAERDRLKRKIELMESGGWRCEIPDDSGKFFDTTRLATSSTVAGVALLKWNV